MAVQFKDYYEVLGLSRTASDDEIKKAFRKLARQYHPDVAKNKKQAEEKFKDINEAYEVLGDSAKRKKYDELGQNWSSGSEFRAPPGWMFRHSRRASPWRPPWQELPWPLRDAPERVRVRFGRVQQRRRRGQRGQCRNRPPAVASGAA